MEINSEKIINSLAEKYINDLAVKCKDEIYAIFDIIIRHYKEKEICLICEGDIRYDGHYSRHYYYNNCRIACDNDIFVIINDPFQLVIQANYCPICGRELK